MRIEVKKALLEGHQPEEITEAVHANHPGLDKSKLTDPKTSYINGKAIEVKRNAIAKELKELRSSRDRNRQANFSNSNRFSQNQLEGMKNISNQRANAIDNKSRAISQTGGPGSKAKEFSFTNNGKSKMELAKSNPRIISSAKQ